MRFVFLNTFFRYELNPKATPSLPKCFEHCELDGIVGAPTRRLRGVANKEVQRWMSTRNHALIREGPDPKQQLHQVERLISAVYQVINANPLIGKYIQSERCSAKCSL